MTDSSERTFLDDGGQDDAREHIIGPVDSRVQISSEQLKWDPFTGILELEIVFPSDTVYGTAWLIGKNVAVTAGHNLVNKSGSSASSILLRQAHSGNSSKARSYFVKDEFRASPNNPNIDFGVIELATPISDAANLGYAAYNDSDLRGENFNIVGFPVDKPRHTMWFHSGMISSLSPSMIGYAMDTHGGQSGAPVIDAVRVGGQQKFVSVGIHQGYDPSKNENLAARINSSVFNAIESWRAKIE